MMKKFIKVKDFSNLKDAQDLYSVLFTKGYDNIDIKQISNTKVEVRILQGTHDNLEDTLSELIDDGYNATLVEC